MLKNTLESIIEKYYLNGLTESAKYIIKDKSIVISFKPDEHQSLMGKITHTNFDIPTNHTIGIMNTTQLLKFIKILDTNIELKIHEDRNIADIMTLSDNQYDLEYYLAELNLIKPVPKMKVEPKYDIQLNIDNSFITKFTNAKKALGDIKQFTIEAKDNKLTFILGEGRSYSNKVKFFVEIASNEILSKIPFSVDLFNEILLANKKPTQGMLELSKEGMIKTTFQEGSLASEYFLVRLEDI